jgi:hypothetical protein
MGNLANLAKAVINVMKAVNGIEKNATVGSGNYSYKGVNDKDVKEAYKKAMEDNGLCILPIDVQDEVRIDRWEEESYGKVKQKQSIFTTLKTKYVLLHESGESQIIAGYGHGIDSGDKGAGKATTYAMKYALLYTFMTPTGDIDDSDKVHSEEQAKPVVNKKPSLTKDKVEAAINWAKENSKDLAFMESQYSMSKEVKELIEKGLS